MIQQLLTKNIQQAFQDLYQVSLEASQLIFQATRKEFEGDLTFVVFPFTKQTKKNPEQLGQELGNYLSQNMPQVTDFNVVKGFLNLVIADSVWISLFKENWQNADFFNPKAKNEKVMVEYSSPNTNKPLHLGHLRNNFLGYSVSQILRAAGYEVMMSNLVNDRGIHICKSMLAYQEFGNQETPESLGIKGDKLVGNYYVKFDQENKKYIAQLIEEYQAKNPDENPEKRAERASKNSPLLLKAQEMLKKWEENDPQTVDLWKKMNGWVYAGFDETYRMIGVSFDKIYYESQTYLLGKSVVEEGLAKGVFFKKEDGSVWIDLTEDGLDQKLLLRADGTSVYITQDLGTADLKYSDFAMQKSVYVVGNEQDYHFKVLKLIMQKLARSYAQGIYHLSYGMVELPSGKMKSREGTVVDADDLLAEMIEIAAKRTLELGKIDGFSEEEAKKLFRMLALGALKYYLLKVEPKKTMLFNPEDSIDFQGDTGVYVQYTHAKISSVIRRAKQLGYTFEPNAYSTLENLSKTESDLVKILANYPEKVQEAAQNYSPSVMANYVYDVCKTYSRFYAELSILNESDEQKRAFRIAISDKSAQIIQISLALLGIESPERM